MKFKAVHLLLLPTIVGFLWLAVPTIKRLSLGMDYHWRSGGYYLIAIDSLSQMHLGYDGCGLVP